MSTISSESVASLRRLLDGVVASPGEEAYAEAVNIWNGACARRPSIVVRCTSSGDVAHALSFARERALSVSVRGGGHNYAGFALCDDGLMIDLTPMKAVSVDAPARRARCGGGTTWAELDAATQAHALAVPGGFISHTGVGGLTLGGGFGWLTRVAGLTCDNLVGAEVVTADGRVLQASPSEHPDLLWALRGGGGNFGVVTEFEFQLHPVGPLVQLGLFLFLPEQGREMFRFARDYIETLPDDCGVFMAGLNAPPEPFVPAELQLRPVFALLVVGLHDEANHAALVEPIRQQLSAAVELITPIPYVGLQQMFDASAPWGLHNYEKAVYLSELSDAAIDVILEHQAKKVSPLSFAPIFPMGGVYRSTDANSTAFGGSRDFRYIVNISGTAMSPEDFDAERSWCRSYWAALVEHAVGVGSYVNFMTEYEEDRVRAAYGDKYERLQHIKATYDPDNVFRLNANITPAL